ncbi:DivIVA domain-containing protein [Mycobacterium conspicuum]|uniref:DivIVA domain-containing protein n=1 Tax=Mycobacterium conspicuum TaxID=44010 RepID=UPI000A149983|nr:DivIVA domain-containing protein [Mycobacterium conspicuum]ORV33922.1 cell division protein DivIVA [Mycobacterium conspicuum]
MITEPAKAFSRRFAGYDPSAVDAHIEMLTTKQQLLIADVESLRARLKESAEETAALRKEVAVLTDTSPAPQAVQQRMAKMLRRAVDEVSEMQAEARAEAEAMIETAKAEIEDEQRKHKELLAELSAQQQALQTEYEETRKTLEGELARLRADAQQERERLLADAKQGVEKACQQRVKILEQLMGVFRDLEEVPAALESAYQELKNPLDGEVVSLDEKVRTG